MSDLFTVQAVAYMDDGSSNTVPATAADVRLWAAERGYALVPVDLLASASKAITLFVRTVERNQIAAEIDALIAAAQEKSNDPTP